MKPTSQTAEGVIAPDHLYSIAAIAARSGFGPSGIREARKQAVNPLKVLYVRKRAFVRGRDFIDFVNANGSPVHHSQEQK